MRKTSKMAISFLLSMVMCLTMFVNILNDSFMSQNQTFVYAISQSEVEAKLSSLMNQYVGTTWNDDYYGIQCKGFANLMFYKLFDVKYIGAYDSEKYYIPNPSGATEVGKLGFSSMSENGAKELLSKGYPGDLIQVRRREKSWGHTMILVNRNESGITVFDCNSDGKNGVKSYHITWNSFYSKNSAMSLYHANGYDASSLTSSFPGEEDSSYSVPISVTASKKINTYDGSGNLESNRWIDAGDVCTIDKVYKNGFVHVGYPTSSGTRWAYAKKEDFDINPPAPSSHSPEICVDSVTTGPGTISIGGWAYDPDNKDASLQIHVYMDDDNKWVGGTVTQYDDEDVLKAVIGSASVYKHRFAATFYTNQTGNHRLNIAALDSGNDGASWSGHDISIPADTTKPVVSNAKFSKITSSGFTVQCNATDDVKIKSVKVAIWIDGVTEPIWHDCVSNGGDVYSFDFDISSYENKTGPYNCHIYAWDENDNSSMTATDTITLNCNLGDNFDAFIKGVESGKFVTVSDDDNVMLYDSSAKVSRRIWNFQRNAEDSSYKISSYCNSKCLDVHNRENADGTNIQTFVPNNSDAQKWFLIRLGDSYCLKPVYSEDKLIDISGNMTDNETDINLWTMNGTSAQKFNIEKLNDSTVPSISKVEISNITEDGYKVTITVSDDVAVKKVAVPTWTKANGQDDLFNEWENTALATQIPGTNTWTYDVKTSDHNNERGIYYTDVYAWDFSDNTDAWRGENKKRTTINVKMYVAGDVNTDGEFNVADAVLIQKWLLGVTDTKLADWENADLCKDGKLDVFDFCIIRKMLVNS